MSRAKLYLLNCVTLFVAVLFEADPYNCILVMSVLMFVEEDLGVCDAVVVIFVVLISDSFCSEKPTSATILFHTKGCNRTILLMLFEMIGYALTQVMPLNSHVVMRPNLYKKQ